MNSLPQHLRKYIVEQHYERYTPVDQAVWRFIMRQLRAFLTNFAHPCYLEGLEKTGIETERIPRIEDISEKLSHFGWRAIPVSGFIPPAAFMELQSLSVLPIASDLRTLDHLLYTPAPDIVHEAAGHAPILVNPEFAQYLREYAQVARKAILSREDLNQYEAIRVLSDLKENPDSTPAQIQAAQNRLDEVSRSMSHVSEAGELSRMNWWTAEYGLIGDLTHPRIFGAGLLSSVGESRWCLSDRVKKIPLSLDCIRTSYDITEPQPQLFVTPDFQTLSTVLEEMAAGMAFRTGGIPALRKALQARSVNTVQLETGLQIGGELCEIMEDDEGRLAYLRFAGPCQLAVEEKELAGHGRTYHAQGFGTPLGLLKGERQTLSKFSAADLERVGAVEGREVHWVFESGIELRGRVKSITRHQEQIILFAFENARVQAGDRVLFDPSWGTFDMAVGQSVPSVWGGPPDRGAYGEVEDFVAARVPQRRYTEGETLRHEQYRHLRELRENDVHGEGLMDRLKAYLMTHDEHFPQDWLFRVEALELVCQEERSTELEAKLRRDLERIQSELPDSRQTIADGIALATEWV